MNRPAQTSMLPETADALEQAKLRLRDALSRLENTVEGNANATQEALAAGANEKQEEINKLKHENKHLREELAQLQARIGEAQIQVTNYKKVNEEAAKRMDSLIAELKQTVAA